MCERSEAVGGGRTERIACGFEEDEEEEEEAQNATDRRAHRRNSNSNGRRSSAPYRYIVLNTQRTRLIQSAHGPHDDTWQSPRLRLRDGPIRLLKPPMRLGFRRQPTKSRRTFRGKEPYRTVPHHTIPYRRVSTMLCEASRSTSRPCDMI